MLENIAPVGTLIELENDVVHYENVDPEKNTENVDPEKTVIENQKNLENLKKYWRSKQYHPVCPLLLNESH